MNRAWTLIILTLASWALVIGAAWAVHIEVSHAPQATDQWMQANRDQYFPTLDNRCSDGACVLTGPGGYLVWWDLWLDMAVLLKSNFRVSGICASACEREYLRAVNEYHLTVPVEDGARLIEHARPA